MFLYFSLFIVPITGTRHRGLETLNRPQKTFLGGCFGACWKWKKLLVSIQEALIKRDFIKWTIFELVPKITCTMSLGEQGYYQMLTADLEWCQKILSSLCRLSQCIIILKYECYALMRGHIIQLREQIQLKKLSIWCRSNLYSIGHMKRSY